ncbi:hypothetical protein PMAC_001413 [Pneumocystis sp. 'macacae']|nr:hypothetical protein PMAC_001413 [Pneumocystis sp. 'macacae']
MSASYVGVSESTIQWVVYEDLKQRAGGQETGWVGVLAGGAAKLAAAVATYPHEVVRTRLREAPREGSARYRGLVECFCRVWREEGVGGLYGGLGAHLLRVIPSAGIVFGSYEASDRADRAGLGLSGQGLGPGPRLGRSRHRVRAGVGEAGKLDLCGEDAVLGVEVLEGVEAGEGEVEEAEDVVVQGGGDGDAGRAEVGAKEGLGHEEVGGAFVFEVGGLEELWHEALDGVVCGGELVEVEEYLGKEEDGLYDERDVVTGLCEDDASGDVLETSEARGRGGIRCRARPSNLVVLTRFCIEESLSKDWGHERLGQTQDCRDTREKFPFFASSSISEIET